MIAQGYIKLYRSLAESEIFQNEKLLKVFIWCLLKASHKEREQRIGRQIVKLQDGQFVFGRNTASIELNMAPSTLWDYMKLLEERKTINIKSNNKFSVVTVEKWAIYQCKEEIADIKTDKKQTSNKQQMDTNKNVKNDKNNIYSRVITRLNSVTGKSYKPTTKKTIACIDARLKEGFIEDDFYKVIEIKTKEWSGTNMEIYLRPETLFGAKFEGYLNQEPKDQQLYEKPKGKVIEMKIGEG